MEKASPLPGFLHWRVGQKLVTVINDGYFQASEAYLTGLPAGGVAGLLADSFQPAQPLVTINAFLVQGDGHPPVLIDAGLGTKAAPALVGNLLQTLPATGLTAADIGLVLLTHLHGDHFYGLVAADGTRNFPNARVWVSAEEYAYWLTSPRLSETDQQNARDVRQAFAPYEVIVPTLPDQEIVPGLTAVRLPGHTPGHTGFRVQSEGEELLIWGDIVSVPAVQGPLPQVGFASDVDSELARSTRLQTLADAAARRLLIVGSHTEFPGLYYVKPNGAGYRFVPKQWIG